MPRTSDGLASEQWSLAKDAGVAGPGEEKNGQVEGVVGQLAENAQSCLCVFYACRGTVGCTFIQIAGLCL